MYLSNEGQGKLSSVCRDSPTQIHLLSPISTNMNAAENFREKDYKLMLHREPIVAMFLEFREYMMCVLLHYLIQINN